VPLRGALAGEAHGLLRVFEVGDVGGVVAFFRDAVLDQEAGDADGVEPLAGVRAFAVPCEAGVAAAREDERGDVGVAAGRWQVDAHGGFGDIGEALGALAVEERVRGLGGVGFGFRGLGRLRRAVRPERDDGDLRVGDGGKP
jgi:hypothetical protein